MSLAFINHLILYSIVMKLKTALTFIALMITGSLAAQQNTIERITANPLNLSYRFQIEGVCRREAADLDIRMNAN